MSGARPAFVNGCKAVTRRRVLIAACHRSRTVIFRAQTRGTDCGHYRQELFERHLQVQKPALTKDPSVVVENLVRNHQWQSRQRRNQRKPSRFLDPARIGSRRRQYLLADHAAITQRHHFSSGASSHEFDGLPSRMPPQRPYSIHQERRCQGPRKSQSLCLISFNTFISRKKTFVVRSGVQQS